MKRLTCASLLCVAASATLLAAPITPTFDTFGTLSGATFGGSGIPNNAVAITTIGNVTLGLTAHARYVNPPVSNNGAGIFTAVAGGDIYTPAPNTQPTWARWNFGWYASNTGSTPYILELLYDFDPAVGTDESVLGKTWGPLGPATLQDSWNLGMAFLDTSTPPFVTPPTYPSFDPNVSGEYSFALISETLQQGLSWGGQPSSSTPFLRVAPRWVFWGSVCWGWSCWPGGKAESLTHSSCREGRSS